MCSVVGVGAGAAAALTAGKTRAGHACHLPRDVQHAVLPDDVPARVRADLGAAMTSDVDLSEIVMALYAAGGQIAGMVSGKVHHAQPIDWPRVLTLAEVVRVNAATLALLAEREIEQQAVQASLGLL